MDHQQSFGVFKPVGHVVISFPTEEQSESARQALEQTHGNQLRQVSDRQMLAQIREDLERASPLAAIGQELNLVKAQQALAEMGYHWLVVRAGDRDEAQAMADEAQEHGAERAQYYGHFIVEELIRHRGDLPQVAESPDRGLDAKTPSGREAERARMRASSQGTHR